jgi:microcystin-dependent protein
MDVRLTAFALGCALFMGSAAAQECVGRLSTVSLGEELLACLREMAQEREALKGVRSSTSLPPPSAIPAGAVLAFAGPCPTDGWSPFSEGIGKFILGAGSAGVLQPKVNGVAVAAGVALAERFLFDEGGEEQHALLPAEVPHFQPAFVPGFEMTITDVVPCLDGGCNQHGALTNGFRSGQHANVPQALNSIGEDRPHNNMPPFIALTYCRKQ